MDKQKGLAPILVVLLIVLAVGGYLLYQKQFKPAFTPQSPPSPIASDETANWKTYTNNKYKYSFKYPPSWISNEAALGDIVNFRFEGKDSQYYFFVGSGGRGGPEADGIKGDNPKYGNVSYSRRMWIKNDTPFFIVALPDKPYSVGGNIEINFPLTEADYYTKTFDQILSTFRFLQ